MSFGNRGQGTRSNPRLGLLGAGPGSLGRPQVSNPMRRDRAKLGLLGSAPIDYRQDDDMEDYGREERYPGHQIGQSFEKPNSYSNSPYQGGDERYGSRQQSPQSSVADRIPANVRRIMSDLGLTSSDLEKLSRLPEEKLSSHNIMDLISELRESKQTSMSSSNRHSFESRDRPRERDGHEPYDPAKPTGSGYRNYENPEHYSDERQNDAFSSFQEKWYSEGDKKNDRDQQASAGSILRGSRGPVALGRWEREELPPAKPSRRPSPPPMAEPRRLSPLPVRRPSPPPPMRRMSPPRRMSPRRMTPPPRRMSTPPPRMPPGISARHGGLLGDPMDPSTQGLDMLVASVSGGRSTPRNSYQQPRRDFPEPERFPRERARSRTPPPLMQQLIQPREEPRPIMHAMPQEPLPRQGPSPSAARKRPKPDIYSFAKDEAIVEATAMRRQQGRVLYMRYQAGGMGTIREEHLVKLAQPFEKVTNILLVAPRNLKTGWYQAFLELAHFDGAAAMLEHYMIRPPSIAGIRMMVQRSKYQNLKLRESQMNRDFDKFLGFGGDRKRRRAASLSPDRSVKRPVKKDESRAKPDKAPKKRRSLSNERRSSSRSAKGDSNDKKKNSSGDTKDRKKNGNEKPKNSKAGSTKDEARSDSDKSKDKNAGDKKGKPKKEEKKEPESPPETKAEEEKEESQANGFVDVSAKLKSEKNKERLDIIRDNLEQANLMFEDLLKILEDESAKEIISEVMEYVADSSSQLNEIEGTLLE